MRNCKKYMYFIPVVLWMIVIFLFSSQAGEISGMNNHFVLNVLRSIGLDITGIFGEDTANYLIRKAGHVTEFLILFMLSYNAFLRCKLKKSLAYGILLTVTYAATDELHQMFVPDRGPLFQDVLIDCIGVVIGAAIVLIFRRPVARGKQQQDEQKA